MKMRSDQILYIYSMGKRLRVTALFFSDTLANQYLENHSDEGVVAVFEPFIFIANLHDRGMP